MCRSTDCRILCRRAFFFRKSGEQLRIAFDLKSIINVSKNTCFLDNTCLNKSESEFCLRNLMANGQTTQYMR